MYRKFWFLLLLGTSCTSMFNRPETDIRKYDEIIKEQRNNSYFAHFPKELNKDIEKAKLYYQRGFLQGGTILQLMCKYKRYEYPNLRYRNKADSIYSVYKDLAISNINFNSLDTINSDAIHDLPAHFYIYDPFGNYDGDILPCDFEILVLSSNDKGKLTEYVNHGFNRGLAISKKRNLLIYWIENW